MSQPARRVPEPHSRNRGFAWTDAPANGARRASAAQIAQFNAQGFFVYENAFSADEIAKVAAAIDPLEAQQDALERAKASPRRLDFLNAMSFTVHIAQRDPVLKAFAQHEVYRDLCHDLMGAGPMRLYWDQSVYKKSGNPQEFPWHQDNGYTFTEPQQYLTCWTPLVDVDEENGCPWIAPGWHKGGTLAHWQTPIGLKCMEDAGDAVCAPAKAGDIVVFSSLAPHRTGPNLKPGSVRKAYILQYAPDGAIAYRNGDAPEPQDDPDRQFLI